MYSTAGKSEVFFWDGIVRTTRRGSGERKRHFSHPQFEAFAWKEGRRPHPFEMTYDCYSEAPRGRKYWVPLTGSWRRPRRSWRSSLRSTKSMSEVFMTRRSEAAERKKNSS